jgi:hypothetical protein
MDGAWFWEIDGMSEAPCSVLCTASQAKHLNPGNTCTLGRFRQRIVATPANPPALAA